MQRKALDIWDNILPRLGFVQFRVKCMQHKPLEEEIVAKHIYIIGGKSPKWAVMKCPCNCGDTINICLMKSHHPCWKIRFDKWKRISFSPSIRKLDGCKSHFFINKSCINWV